MVNTQIGNRWGIPDAVTCAKGIGSQRWIQYRYIYEQKTSIDRGAFGLTRQQNLTGVW